MPRERRIEWPNGARICLTFIIPYEVWPDDLGTAASRQRQPGHHIPPPDARFNRSMSAVTEREYGDRVGIWRLLELFERHEIKTTLLMNGLKAVWLGRPENAGLLAEIASQGHEYSSEGFVHEYSYMYTREEEDESMKKTIAAFEECFGTRPTGYLSPGHCYTDNTLDLVAENSYKAEVSLGVGPVRGRFHATVELSDLDPPNAVRLSGSLAGPLGATRGAGQVRLEARDGGTHVSYDFTVEISGKVAAVGGRMLEGASRVVVGQFFQRLVAQVGGPKTASATPAPGTPETQPSLWQRLLAMLGTK